MSRARFFAVLGAATATAVLVTTSGCSSGQPKTAAGFCQVYHQQEDQYLAQYGKPDSGLAGLGQLTGALSDWVPIFQALDQAAPPDIEPAVHNILDSLQQEEHDVGNEASDPLGGFASALLSGVMSTGSWQQLSTYIEQNCGG